MRFRKQTFNAEKFETLGSKVILEQKIPSKTRTKVQKYEKYNIGCESVEVEK